MLTGVGVLQVMLEQYSFMSKMFSSDILTKEMETKLRALVREGEVPTPSVLNSSKYCLMMRPPTQCGQGSGEDTPSSNVEVNQQLIQISYRSLLLEVSGDLSVLKLVGCWGRSQYTYSQ